MRWLWCMVVIQIPETEAMQALFQEFPHMGH